MQPLRSARVLARLVLAWFALVVAAAAAGPVFQPQSLELVCSGGGMKLVAAADDEGGPPAQVAGLDCPLCAALPAPPAALPAPRLQPLGLALHPIVAARIAALTAAPLPARGPPSSCG